MTATLPPPSRTSPHPSPTHAPQTAYTSGLPAPPRVLIPPPSMSLDTHLYTQSFATPTSLLASDSILPGTVQDWKYESRRQAQQILPHLFLGPLSAAKDIEFLRANKITQLLAIRSSMASYSRLLNQPPPDGVIYNSIDILNQSALISQFQRSQQLIDEHYMSQLPEDARKLLPLPLDGRMIPTFRRRWLEARGEHLPSGGCTLVFCESGNERSAAVVAAYIMQHMAGSAVQAIQMVQGRRFCVCFDDTTKWMLTSYEPIWMARRQAVGGEVGRCTGGGVGGGGGKRRFVSEEAEEGGKGRAPFVDSDDVMMD